MYVYPCLVEHYISKVYRAVYTTQTIVAMHNRAHAHLPFFHLAVSRSPLTECADGSATTAISTSASMDRGSGSIARTRVQHTSNADCQGKAWRDKEDKVG